MMNEENKANIFNNFSSLKDDLDAVASLVLSKKDMEFIEAALGLKLVNSLQVRECLQEMKEEVYTPYLPAKIMMKKGWLKVDDIQKINHQIEQNIPKEPEAKPIQKFDRYLMLEKLGEGGMGIVFKAYDPKLARIVAIKTIKSASPTAKKRFLREARATAALKHPNIVQLYEFGESERVLFFTMEYVQGLPLNKINTQAWSFRKTIHFMIEICRAMEYSHSQSIVHRDLKPANILLMSDEKPKIMDFGLAKIGHDKSRLSQSGEILGTILYMSYEQACGNIRQIDNRSDIYSLGCILYELLVGQPPFYGKTFEQVLRKIKEEIPTPPSQKKTTLPSYAIDDVCMKALEKNQNLRYQNVQDFREDLERILDNQQPVLSTRDRLRKLKYFYRKHRHVFALLLIFLVGWIVYRNFQEKDVAIPLEVECVLPLKMLRYSRNKLLLSIKNLDRFTIDSIQIKLMASKGLRIYREEPSSGNNFSLFGNTSKDFHYEVAPLDQSEQKIQFFILHKNRIIKNIEGKIDILASRYGLPIEIEEKCLILNDKDKNEYILDQASNHWEKLSPFLQSEYARCYQYGYALYKNYPYEKVVQYRDVSFLFALIPPGCFWMGIDETTAKKIRQNKNDHLVARLMPKHRVTISQAFYISKTEITIEQWKTFDQDYKTVQPDELPKHSITYQEAEEFCKQAGFALPTEAQWEYACRAGSTYMFYWGDTWDKNLCNTASYWLAQDWWEYSDQFKSSDFDLLFPRYQAGPTVWKKFQPNAFGLHDMLGNLFEWCKDRAYNYSPDPVCDPVHYNPDIKLALRRGGSWYHPILYNTCSFRHPYYKIDYRHSLTGFRPAFPIPEQIK